MAANNASKRAKEFGVKGKWTGKQFLALCAKYDNRCVCCGKTGKLGPDHVVPFSRGGSNHLSNIQPLCWPCNLRKGERIIDYCKQAVKTAKRAVRSVKKNA